MLFLYQETYYVTPGLQDVIDQRVRSLHENHQTNPAAIAMDWMKYLGDATTYLAFRLWNQREVTFDETQYAFMSEYNRTRPSDAFFAPVEIEFFEQVGQAGESGGAGAMVRCDMESGGRGAWSDWEKELKGRLLQSEGFQEYRLYRFMGGESKYFRAEFWQTLDAARAFWQRSDLREFVSKLPQRPYRRALHFRFYEVLHQLGDASIR